jgi:hydroxyacylglutathione hydrolase
LCRIDRIDDRNHIHSSRQFGQKIRKSELFAFDLSRETAEAGGHPFELQCDFGYKCFNASQNISRGTPETKMKIVQIPLLRDNYGYLIMCQKTNAAAVIDPSESEPVLRRVEEEQVALTAILNTHHHRDHTGGNEGLLASAKQLAVLGHNSDAGRIPGLNRGVDDGDEVEIGELRGKVLFIPGHTTGHIAYLFGSHLFCGDTLFTGGCGRLFEGTPEQMQASLKKLMALPDQTKIYCGHEYTENNLRFAVTLEPKNHKLISRFERVQGLRTRGVSTVPSTLEEEKQTNPFLRWDSKEIQKTLKARSPDLRLDPVSVFAKVRQLKDSF